MAGSLDVIACGRCTVTMFMVISSIGALRGYVVINEHIGIKKVTCARNQSASVCECPVIFMMAAFVVSKQISRLKTWIRM